MGTSSVTPTSHLHPVSRSTKRRDFSLNYIAWCLGNEANSSLKQASWMKCTSPWNSFCAVESTTDEKGEGNEQTEAETEASEEVSWPRQLGALRSRVLGRGLRELGSRS
jgi:hypothetical protein